MDSAASFSGKYFDGESAAAQDVRVSFGAFALSIETSSNRVEWDYRDLILSPGPADDIRIGVKRFPDALLVLPHTAHAALQEKAPNLFDRKRARRRFTALVAALIGGAAAVGAVLFIGVPAASGPMAQATPRSFELTIGANMAAQITTIFRPCKGVEALGLVAPAIDEFAGNADVGFPITFQFVKTPAPNAFALPGGQVMATAGLLDALGDDQEAFWAVIAHELGHVRARDGLRAFYRNAGLGVALEIITGGSGAAQQAVLLGGQISQLRFTRIQEEAADQTAFEILEQARLDPSALARAFEKIEAYANTVSDAGDDEDGMPGWMKTHPNTDARIQAARARARQGDNPPLSDAAWRTVTGACS